MLNPYLPKLAKVDKIINETENVKTFKLRLLNESDARRFSFNPGQFIIVSVFGVGEAPFAIASSPLVKDYFEISVRAIGNVTRALHGLGEGDVVGVRGPLGNGYPLDELKGKNVVFIAGGTGLFGVSSLLWYIYENRSFFNDVMLFYGTRTPKDFMRKYDIDVWRNRIDVYLTVDRADVSWKGHVGLVTSFLDEIPLPKKEVAFIVCGPPLMMKATYRKLLSLGYSPNQIYVSLERQMKCGIGKCGRCMLSNGKFVCKDGPVFRCDQIPERDIE